MTKPMLCARSRLIISLVFGLVVLMSTAAAARQGGQIVFSSKVEGNTDIYIMDEDGTNVRRLTDDPASDISPRWSPGGKRIVFTSGRGGTGNIYLMDAAGGNLRRVTDNPEFAWAPVWSPDSQHIAFFATYERHGIHIIDVDGRNVRFLTDARELVGNPADHFQRGYGLDWSPDGSTILFNTHNNDTTANIWAIDSDGRNARNLSDDGEDGCLAWSPDGKRILFNFYGVDGGFYTMRPDGGDRVEVLAPATGACPRWSPDGREIIFSMDDDIHTVSAKGKNLRRLVRLPGTEYGADWFDPAYARAVSARSREPMAWGRLKRPPKHPRSSQLHRHRTDPE